MACWLNGHPIEQLSPLERGFAYGDGLFSTMNVVNSHIALLDLHWQRLAQGCQRLAINSHYLETWQQDFQRFLAVYANNTVKIIVTRGEGGRGYLADANAMPHCYFYAYESTAHSLLHQQGINTGFLTTALGLNPLLAGIKHLNRLEQVLLRQELAQTPFPEALVCDINGHVVEGVFSNVFLVRQQQLYTPRLHQAGVAGVMRQQVCTLANTLGFSVEEQLLMADDFLAADEIFFCNSLYGLWPVRQINGIPLGDNPVTHTLQQHLQQQLAYV